MRTLLIDDHELFRSGLKQLLEEQFEHSHVIEASDLEAGLDILAQTDAPDLIVADLNMPGSSGPESIRALVEAYPDIRIVVMSGSEDPADILGCVSAGVDGYIPKSLPVREMIEALKQVLRGSVFIPRASRRTAAVTEAPSRLASWPGLDHLTQRQREVLDQLLRGQSTKEIARILDLAEGTVKIHLAAVYRVLGVRSRAEAIARLMSRDQASSPRK